VSYLKTETKQVSEKSKLTFSIYTHMSKPASKTFPVYVYALYTYTHGKGSHIVKSEYSRCRTTNQSAANKLTVLSLVFGISIWKGKEKLIIIISATELKQDMCCPETKGCKLEDRRNVSFSSCRFRNAFLLSEIIIKLNVNLITSNQLSDIGKVGEVQPALVGRVQRTEHWVTN